MADRRSGKEERAIQSSDMDIEAQEEQHERGLSSEVEEVEAESRRLSDETSRDEGALSNSLGRKRRGGKTSIISQHPSMLAQDLFLQVFLDASGKYYSRRTKAIKERHKYYSAEQMTELLRQYYRMLVWKDSARETEFEGRVSAVELREWWDVTSSVRGAMAEYTELETKIDYDIGYGEFLDSVYRTRQHRTDGEILAFFAGLSRCVPLILSSYFRIDNSPILKALSVPHALGVFATKRVSVHDNTKQLNAIQGHLEHITDAELELLIKGGANHCVVEIDAARANAAVLAEQWRGVIAPRVSPTEQRHKDRQRKREPQLAEPRHSSRLVQRAAEGAGEGGGDGGRAIQGMARAEHKEQGQGDVEAKEGGESSESQRRPGRPPKDPNQPGYWIVTGGLALINEACGRHANLIPNRLNSDLQTTSDWTAVRPSSGNTIKPGEELSMQYDITATSREAAKCIHLRCSNVKRTEEQTAALRNMPKSGRGQGGEVRLGCCALQ